MKLPWKHPHKARECYPYFKVTMINAGGEIPPNSRGPCRVSEDVTPELSPSSSGLYVQSPAFVTSVCRTDPRCQTRRAEKWERQVLLFRRSVVWLFSKTEEAFGRGWRLICYWEMGFFIEQIFLAIILYLLCIVNNVLNFWDCSEKVLSHKILTSCMFCFKNLDDSSICDLSNLLLWKLAISELNQCTGNT